MRHAVHKWRCMKIPYKRHLSWLILTGKDRDRIEKIYNALTIPKPTQTVFEEAERYVLEHMPIPGSIRRRIEKKVFEEKDVSFFEILNFGYLYKVTFGAGFDDLKKTHQELKEKILDQPIVRIAIECCLIKKIGPEEISALINQGYGFTIDKEVIEQFEDIFFDVKTFDKDDWREYLNHIASCNENYMYSRYFAALTKSRDEVMHLIGLPTKKSFSNFLETVLTTSDYKFRFYSRQGTQEGDRHARYWADVGLKAGEKFEKFSSKDATDFAQTIQTEFVYIDQDIPMAEAELISSVKATNQIEDKTAVTDKQPDVITPVFIEREV